MAKSVEIHPEQIRRHYASLSDDALLELDPDDLTEIGRQYYEVEMASRRLRGASLADPAATRPVFSEDDLDSDWAKDEVCAFAQPVRPGTDSAGDAATVMEALEKSHIPCRIAQEHVESRPSSGYDEYRVMVPARYALEASSILDRDIFNANLEAEWRAHFAELTNAELIAVDTEVLFAGLVDRIERVKRAYADEVQRRGLARNVSGA